MVVVRASSWPDAWPSCCSVLTRCLPCLPGCGGATRSGSRTGAGVRVSVAGAHITRQRRPVSLQRTLALPADELAQGLGDLLAEGVTKAGVAV